MKLAIKRIKISKGYLESLWAKFKGFDICLLCYEIFSQNHFDVQGVKKRTPSLPLLLHFP